MDGHGLQGTVTVAKSLSFGLHWDQLSQLGRCGTSMATHIMEGEALEGPSLVHSEPCRVTCPQYHQIEMMRLMLF